MDAVEELTPQVGTVAACRALGVSRASLYRRRRPKAQTATVQPVTPRQPRELDPQERQTVLDVLHSPRFVDQAPAAVYAALLDEGVYHCSIRTMYRILHDAQEVRERRAQLRHPQYRKPELLATAPHQVWSWDITRLRGSAKWNYYLYAMLDIYSRYTVGWMVATAENAELAKRFIQDTIEKYCLDPKQLTIHSDRGSPMKAQCVAQLLANLGVTKSHSRPHVSDDNPFSEAQFKTLKYRPDFPDRFGGQEDARGFCQQFFHWYNHQHYHSAIALLTPADVHFGRAHEKLKQRQTILDAAYAEHPERFIHKRPMAPTLPDAVWINPPPANDPQNEKRLPQTQGLQKPDAPSAHPRSEYPSAGCVPAEPASVSSDNNMLTKKLDSTSTFGHPRHALENPGGLGAGPQKYKHCSQSESKIH